MDIAMLFPQSYYENVVHHRSLWQLAVGCCCCWWW